MPRNPIRVEPDIVVQLVVRLNSNKTRFKPKVGDFEIGRFVINPKTIIHGFKLKLRGFLSQNK